MKRIAILAAVAAALMTYAQEAEAQTVACTGSSPCVFTTVDEVLATANKLYVTGILEGEAIPAKRYVTFSTSASLNGMDVLAACQRLALLAMARPGQYVLRMALPLDSFSFTTCGLSRVTP